MSNANNVGSAVTKCPLEEEDKTIICSFVCTCYIMLKDISNAPSEFVSKDGKRLFQKCVSQGIANRDKISGYVNDIKAEVNYAMSPNPIGSISKPAGSPEPVISGSNPLKA